MSETHLTAADWQTANGDFIALWTDSTQAYALYAPGQVVTTPLENGGYPALSPRYPGAAWFERLAHDLNGHTASGGISTRPAVEQFRDAEGRGAWPEFSAAGGEGVHQIGIGPVHGMITEPMHLRFSVRGETVLGLQTRLGYSHRGVLALIRGKSPRLAARFAARICGDATVAHGIAFAQAAEAALSLAVPPRGQYLRALMAELERITNHAGQLAMIAGEAGSAWLETRLSLHRENLAVAAQAAFGHRLMMDVVVPGGVASDLRTGGAAAISAVLDTLEAERPDLAVLSDRLTGIGIISTELATAYALGGPAGRASARPGDTRLSPGYAPYEMLGLEIPLEEAGDGVARVHIRSREIAESIRIIRLLLANLPAGQIAIAPPTGSGTAAGVAESSRGPVWYWLRIESGLIADAFIADASTLLWPLLEQVIIGGVVAEIPLAMASIGASAAGVDF